jgi:hypothetical protein
MTTKLFEMWANDVFFPTVEERRSQAQYQDPALLILDGLGSHHSEAFLEECEHRNIYVIFLVLHSSDQVQPLDLVTFGLLKHYFGQFTFNFLPTAQSNKVVKMMGAWYQATALHQIVAAWMSMGLIPFRGDDGIAYLRLDRSPARNVRGWVHGPPQPVSFGAAGRQRVRLPTG